MNYLKILGVLVLIGGIIGGYFYPKLMALPGSPAGTTFNTAKVAAINISPLTSAATSSSILNTDASARWVKSVDTFCTGVGTSQAWNSTGTGGGLAAWALTVATTSTAAQGSNTNYVGNITTIATSSSFEQSASSTVPTANSANTDLYFWPSNTYLTFTFNATNTAACTVSASYAAS